MKILVTGGNGMVGKHLQEILPKARYIGSEECDLTSWKEVEYIMFCFSSLGTTISTSSCVDKTTNLSVFSDIAFITCSNTVISPAGIL